MSPTTLAPRVEFAHLARMTDEIGLFEHALFDAPRPEHGYCTDDIARALVITMREPGDSLLLARLRETYLRFVLSSLDATGRVHNRMDAQGDWTDEPSTGDWWGRAVWALGVTAALAPEPFTRARAAHGFALAASARSLDSRTMAFAALGAAELLRSRPGDVAARSLLRDAVVALPPGTPEWPWPEPRLRYANGAVAEALIAAGDGLRDAALLTRGLELLRFLIALETRDGHLSVAGTNGRGPGEPGALFDQQPIEVIAIADACARAAEVTGNESWLGGIALALAWFEGDNDSGIAMFDPATGAGFDGLTATGRNENRGAESTIAALGTLQLARRLEPARP